MNPYYMLDTNIVSDAIRNPDGRAAQKIDQNADMGLAMSIITAAELRFGAAKKGSPRLLARVEDALRMIPPLPFDVPADSEYAGIRAELEAAGKPIGPNDLFIAAHAYSLGMTLITATTSEFSRIRGLRLENWLT
ncbi:type II toxin-antitoxin system VapC family toxin [Ochrobactrum sp. GPK 3]|uniref:type II toxin-antitoxin system VapC family toxin n=1 Tax=Brucella sp. 22210 TaxID=3453892 RepID=UPI0031385523